MFFKIAKKIFGRANDRFIGKLQKQVDEIIIFYRSQKH